MMPTFRGNRGNLLQHWVLVELATILRNLSTPPVPQLCFIDAHAMAPLAARHPSPGQTAQDFDAVRDALPGQQSLLTQSRLSASGWVRSILWRRHTNCILAIGEIVFAAACPRMGQRTCCLSTHSCSTGMVRGRTHGPATCIRRISSELARHFSNCPHGQQSCNSRPTPRTMETARMT